MDNYKYKTNNFDVIIEIEPHEVNNRLNRTIIDKIKKLYECKCHPLYGYIKKNSIKILKKSIGKLRPNSFTGSFLYSINIEVQSIKPFVDDVYTCNVISKNNEGLLATVSNLPFNIYIFKELEDEKNETILKLIDEIEDKSVIEIKVIKATLDKKTGNYIIIGSLNSMISLFSKSYSLLNINDDINITSVLIKKELLSVIMDDSNLANFITIKLNKKLKQLKESIGNLKQNEYVRSINIKKGYAINQFTESENNGRKFWNVIKNLIHDYSLLEDDYSYWFREFIISRAFYKMLEMLDFYPLLKDKNMNFLNIAESPGGFVQAILYARNIQGDFKDKYNVVSKAENEQLELWERDNSIIKILRRKDASKYFGDVSIGIDHESEKTNLNFVDANYGDLLENATYDNIMNKLEYNINKADLITADGAFGYNEKEDDYQNQEILHYPLFIAEILVALSCNSNGGHFVLKMFDIFTEVSVKLIYILNCCYETVKIYKPDTSRQANSEKYIICMNFTPPDNISDIIDKLQLCLNEINILCKTDKDICNNAENNAEYINVILDFDISTDFIQSIKTFNDMFIKNEITNISNGIEIGTELIRLLDTNYNITNFNNFIKNKNENKLRLTKNFIKKHMLPEFE